MCDLSVLQCECENLQHNKFNEVSNLELVTKTSLTEIFNESFCINIGVDMIDDENDLSSHEMLLDLKGKVGVYGLWIHNTECSDHDDMHRMLCLYVGKGCAHTRIKQHIKNKWPKEELLYITFYECKNRIAKYIEQLLLDSYDFYLNKDENNGEGSLSTVWNGERVSLGTEIYKQADRLVEKFPNDYQ